MMLTDILSIDKPDALKSADFGRKGVHIISSLDLQYCFNAIKFVIYLFLQCNHSTIIDIGKSLSVVFTGPQWSLAAFKLSIAEYFSSLKGTAARLSTGNIYQLLRSEFFDHVYGYEIGLSFFSYAPTISRQPIVPIRPVTSSLVRPRRDRTLMIMNFFYLLTRGMLADQSFP